jgi:O-antigen ligase
LSDLERRLGALVLSGIAIAALWAVAPFSLPGFERFHLTKELLTLALAVPLLLTLRGFRPDVSDAGVVALLAAVGVSALVAVNPMLAMRGLCVLAVGALCFCCARGLDGEERARLQTVLLIGVGGVALLALAEAMGQVRGFSIGGHAPGATLGQRNNVAHLLTLAAPLTIVRLSSAAARRQRIALGVLLALIAIVVAITRSRAAWIALPIVAVVTMAAARPRVWAVAPLLAGLALGPLVPVRLSWRAADFYRDTASRLFDDGAGSGLGRKIQARASLKLVAEHPLLGIGPRHWQLYYPTVSPPGDPTSDASLMVPNGRLLLCEPLAIAVEWGVPASLLVAAIGWTVLRRSTLGVLVGVALLGCFDAILQLPATMIFAALAVGLELPRDTGPPFRFRALAAAALIPAVVLLAREWEGLRRLEHGSQQTLTSAGTLAPYDYEVQATLGEAHALAGRCDEAAPYLRRATAAAPWFPYPKALSAGCPAAVPRAP